MTAIRLIAGAALLTDGAVNLGPPPLQSHGRVTHGIAHSGATYSGFPKAIKVSESLYLAAYKDGVSHVGAGDGKILTSTDAVAWSVLSTLPSPVATTNAIQDACLAVCPDGRIQCISRHYHATGPIHKNRICYSADNGATWGAWQEINIADTDLVWRTQWHEGVNYVTTYNPTAGGGGNAKLWVGTSDTTFTEHATLLTGTAGGESAIAFLPDDTAVGIVRVGTWPLAGKVITSPAPYTTWTAADLTMPVHGMGMTVHNGIAYGLTRWFIGGVGAAYPACTAVFRMDGTTLVPLAFLPPSTTTDWGDTGYGDVLFVGDVPHAIYYGQPANIAGQVSIYQATIDLGDL